MRISHRPVYEVPGGPSGEFDHQREWVRTDKFPEFQEALKRVNPALELGWDRSNGRWCLIRTDRVNRRMPLGGGDQLSHLEDHFTLAYDICWKTQDSITGQFRKHYRSPSDAILHEVAKSSKKRFELNNGKWATQQLNSIGQAREDKVAAETQKDMDETFEEFSSWMDPNSSTPFTTKIRGAVPSNYGD